MADLFSITAPLMIRTPDGEEKVIAHHFPHPKGLLYFDLYWHEGQPWKQTHVIEGEVTGEGPWKIGDHVINVLGCHGTNSDLAMQYEQWQSYIQRPDADYPPEPLIAAIAKKLGATPD
ncbi:MAG: hypothetical protein ACLFQT_04900 [Thiohalophilus sp.]